MSAPPLPANGQEPFRLTNTGSLRRIGSTIAAQLTNQAATIGMQLLLVPVLLYAWGMERYGAWLVLIALPYYLTASDLGFTAAAKNDMTINAARGDRDAVLRTFQSVFLLLLLVMGALACLLTPVILIVPFGAIWSLGPVSADAAKSVLVLSGATVLLHQWMLLLSAGMRAIGQPAEEVLWGSGGRIVEAAALGCSALLGADLPLAAALMMVSRLVVAIMMIFRLKSLAPWLTLGFGQSSAAEIRRLLGPSLCYMSYMAGHTFMGQGPILALGATAGAKEVVVFSTTRTLARLGVAASNILTFSLGPEFSRCFGTGDVRRFRSIALFGIVATCLLAFLFTIAMDILGGWLLAQWTGQKVMLMQPLFLLLLVGVACEMIWNAAFTPIAAINRHASLSNAFLCASVVTVILCFALPTGQALEGTATLVAGLNGCMVALSGVILFRAMRDPGRVGTLASPTIHR